MYCTQQKQWSSSYGRLDLWNILDVAFSMIISRTLPSHMSASAEAESSTHHSRLPSSIGAAAVKAIHIFSWSCCLSYQLNIFLWMVYKLTKQSPWKKCSCFSVGGIEERKVYMKKSLWNGCWWLGNYDPCKWFERGVFGIWWKLERWVMLHFETSIFSSFHSPEMHL